MVNLGLLDHAFVTEERSEDIVITKIDGGSVVDVTSTTGSIFVLQEIDGASRVTFNAPNGYIVIQGKIDGASSLSACAKDGFLIVGEVNGKSCVTINTEGAASINGQVNGNSSVVVVAVGTMTILGEVNGSSFVHWAARELSVGQVNGDSRIVRILMCRSSHKRPQGSLLVDALPHVSTTMTSQMEDLAPLLEEMVARATSHLQPPTRVSEPNPGVLPSQPTPRVPEPSPGVLPSQPSESLSDGEANPLELDEKNKGVGDN